ncbi:alpha/beta fold hydrolase [Pseudarthrobacter psychrotolerans]|uniref:Alpha/beta fold hydrolase n=1 Tax=Pseudarthrobacter psychrotolerans TaxID=2697569 RepID=A0A6P1NMC9_9MICC|nr:alpha/beta hydrolase [Pseudarthrobacter psychrotolerans]QHK20193.1 alpha/beta fold hydrolase [Pseudarthrobacter psychrotolerans]
MPLRSFSRRTRSVPDDAPPDQPAPDQSPPRRQWRRRGLRVLAAAALTVVGLVLPSTVANLVIEGVERANSTAYGERIQTAHGTINVSRTGETGPTLVLLSGLGTPAPALDFAPLIRELHGYRIVVVEGFGYGYSDMTARPRTIENISEELHEVLAKLAVTGPYVLVGHSIAGFTTLHYANNYPAEVTAVIGIDPTVPTATTAPAEGPAPAEMPPSGNFWERMPSTIGLVRWAAALGLTDPDGDADTTAEIDQMRMLQSWNFGNQALTDETNRVGENSLKIQALRYPDQLPVLQFLARETIQRRPEWQGIHERQLLNVTRHELVVLDGQHYLHWSQSKEMAEKIDAFLGGTP